jgi:serine/arginine repetitive matrix protein 1
LATPASRAEVLKMAQTVDQKLIKRTKFPPEFDKKVDMHKVNLDVIKQ